MTNPELVESVIMDAIQGALAGGVIKSIVQKIISMIAAETAIDELTIASLKEVRQHCLSIADIITRILKE